MNEKLKIEYHSVSELTPYEQNARKHQDIGPLKESIKRFGFNVPILTDESMKIVAGHARFQAAKELGLDQVPVIILKGLSENDLAQFRIVENKTGEKNKYFTQMVVSDNQVAPCITSGGWFFRLNDKRRFSDMDFVNTQSFPQDYKFKKQSAQYVCGMSVPPNMMANVAAEVFDQWLK